MQERRGLVARGRVEGLLRVVALVKLVAPLRAVVDRRHQRQHGLGPQLHAARLLGQQPASVVVEPALQLLVIVLRAHFPGKGRGEKLLAQLFKRVLVVFVPVLQPDGVCEQARDQPVVPAVLLPEQRGARLQLIQRIFAQRVQDLPLRLPVCHRRQHGERHVDVQRRAHAVFISRALQQHRDAAGEPVCHVGWIHHGLQLLLPGFQPGIIRFVVGVIVDRSVLDIVRFLRIRHRRHLRRRSQLPVGHRCLRQRDDAARLRRARRHRYRARRRQYDRKKFFHVCRSFFIQNL